MQKFRLVRTLQLVLAVATCLFGAACSFSPEGIIQQHADRRNQQYSPHHPGRRSRETSLSLSPEDVVAGIGAAARPLLYPAVFAVCFRAGAAVAVIGQPRLPQTQQLRGAHTNRIVGSKIVRLPGLGSRVRLFYPCSPHDDDQMIEDRGGYCTDGRATSDGMAGLVGFKQIGLSFLLAHLADAPSGCYSERHSDGDSAAGSSTPGDNNDDDHGAAVIPSCCEAGAPILVYSHGYGGNMDMATYFLREIAARGIVVAAVEHTDGTASSTVLPGGDRLDFDPSLYTSEEGLKRRARELLEAVDFVPSLFPNTSGGVFLGGHSYGAPSALLALQELQPRGLASLLPGTNNNNTNTNKAISGLVLHDPALAMGDGLLKLPPRTNPPIVSYVSDEYRRAGVECGDATYHVRGAFHGNFVDAPLWAPLWVMRTLSVVIPACGPADPNRVHQELADSAKSFVKLAGAATATTRSASSTTSSSSTAGGSGGGTTTTSTSSASTSTEAMMEKVGEQSLFRRVR